MKTQYKDQSFNMRGEAMTRIETFVAASFAFATTMLVISLGSIPNDMNQFMNAVKNIPSFILSSIIIFQIWHSHADWSRSYGLEDAKTTVLSGSLICIVLVYIYPLRLMMQGLFSTLSGGFFPFELAIDYVWELKFLFSFYAVGFFLLSLTFFFLYRHSLSLEKILQLNRYELLKTKQHITNWAVISGICLLVFILTLTLPDTLFHFSPNFFFLIFPAHLLIAKHYAKKWVELGEETG